MLKKKKNGKMEKTEKQKIREICLNSYFKMDGKKIHYLILHSQRNFIIFFLYFKDCMQKCWEY